jgi:integrase
MRGAYIDPADAKVPFDEVARAWRANMVARPSTLDRVDSVLKNHILPGFEGRAIGDIVPSDIQAWVKRCERAGLAPRSTEVVYRYLSSIFKTAVLDGRIVRSPCIGIRLPKIPKIRVQPLSTEQVAALIEAMPPRYQALIWVGAGAGLRQGEAFGLTVPHLEFLKRNVVVAQQLHQVVGHPVALAPPKTEASVRSIPVGESVLTALARHLELFPPRTSLRGIDGREQLLVFTDETGAPIRRTAFSAKAWTKVVTAAGLPKGTTFHDLRHYYASLLIAHGASVKVVQARLGHKNANETLDTYAHLWPDSEDLTRSAVDAVLGSLAGIALPGPTAPQAPAQAASHASTQPQ